MVPVSKRLLQDQIESSLAGRIGAALTLAPHTERAVTPTGIEQIDSLLSGGLPVGAITEIVGGPCSARATCAHAFVSQVIQRGQVCAWIDSSDSFDAESAAANGINLSQLLLVRCGGAEVDLVSRRAPADRVSRPFAHSKPMPPGSSPHPRNEVQGLPEAVDEFLSSQRLVRNNQKMGTPGASNRSLGSSSRIEQIATDRLPARRGEHLLKDRASFEPRCAEPQLKQRPVGYRKDKRTAASMSGVARAASFWQSNPSHRIDQALRVIDLLMQAGGFGALVLDLGSMAPELVNRIPMSTWFRFRSAADRTRTSVVLLTQHPRSQSSAEIVLRTHAAMPEAGTVMTSLPFAVEILRQRFRPAPSNVVLLRKPPQRAEVAAWSAPTTWVGRR